MPQEVFPSDSVIGQLQQINANTAPVSGVVLPSPFPLDGESAAVKGIYTQQGDILNLISFSSIASVLLLVRVTYIDTTGNTQFLEFQQTTTATRGAQKTTYPLPDGFMYNITVLSINPNSPFTTKRGQIYVNVAYGPGSLYQGSAANFVGLISCYLQDGPTWPVGRFSNFTEGPGYIYNVAPANPAAGADISITVPTGARWRVIAFRGQLTTSAAVANRAVAVVMETNGTLYPFESLPAPIQTAFQAKAYAYLPQYPVVETAFDANNNFRTFIPDMILEAGWNLATNTANIDAGDQWSAASLVVEEWIEP